MIITFDLEYFHHWLAEYGHPPMKSIRLKRELYAFMAEFLAYIHGAVWIKSIPGYSPNRKSWVIPLGSAVVMKREITMPPVNSLIKLRVMAHECGHIRYFHIGQRLNMDSNVMEKQPLFIAELEAEVYSHRILNNLGFPSSRKSWIDSIEYVYDHRLDYVESLTTQDLRDIEACLEFIPEDLHESVSLIIKPSFRRDYNPG